MNRNRLPAIFLLFVSTGNVLIHLSAAECNRKPIEETQAAKSAGTNGFHLEIRQYPRNDSIPPPSGYIPGEYYTIILRGYKTAFTVQTFRGFSIVAVAKDGRDKPKGKFTIPTYTMHNEESVKTSDHCWHAVTQTSLHPKTEVSVVWQAPHMNEGCIDFKAMVLEYRDLWYMDTGNLTQTFCHLTNSRRREVGYEKMIPNDGATECCACDEAKYELIFEGLWSRNTHPRDFPSLVHLTHFSDLIGASHSRKFSMWALGSYATDGLKELAEWGNTYKMEQELKLKAKEIRTIVKARGLWYPNVNGIAKAMFRVDKYHHLASLISMLGPSPDWCVGISAVNLCLPDCSWVGERTFDLYPWDAGTDSGITYMSPNKPSQPREKIREITTKQPRDPRNPFYDAIEDHMPPVARLTLRREKVYPMECKNISEYRRKAEEEISTSEQLEFADRRECMVESWTPWSLCSATCGKGIRMRSRVYKIPIKAQMFNCERQMTEKQFCNAAIDVCTDGDGFNEESYSCQTSIWQSWSECSVTCGNGTRSRTRNFDDLHAATEAGCKKQLIEKEHCEGIEGQDCDVKIDPICRLTYWSDYSPCSKSCGQGVRVRTRMFLYPEHQDTCAKQNLMQKDQCNDQDCDEFIRIRGKGRGKPVDNPLREICKEPVETGHCRGTYPRYYFNTELKRCQRFIYTGCKGNRNNFETELECRRVCDESYTGGEAIGASLTDESDLRGVSDNYIPTARVTMEQRMTVAPPAAQTYFNHSNILTLPSSTAYTRMLPGNEPMNTEPTRGLPSWKVMRRIASKLNVNSIKKVLNPTNGMICVPANQLAIALGVDEVMDGGDPVDCMVTEWSPWSECSRTCGKGRRQRNRSIKVFQRNNGRACPTNLVQKMRCRMRPCPMERCRTTDWSEWSACSNSCGQGVAMRQRGVRPRGGRGRRRVRCREESTQKRQCRGNSCYLR